jgi:hypothetical protein
MMEVKKVQKKKVVPGIELGLPESESDVLTITLYNHLWRQIVLLDYITTQSAASQPPTIFMLVQFLDEVEVDRRPILNVTHRCTLVQLQDTKGIKFGVGK